MSTPGPLHIFISHPSHFLTDSEPHGDGLLAFQYILRLAQRGHQLHVAVPLSSLSQPLPSNVFLYPIRSLTKSSAVNPPYLNRIEYAFRVRRLLKRLQKQFPLQLIHQLNPVVPGMSLLLSGCGLPIVLGPLPPHLPAEPGRSQASATATAKSLKHRIRDRILFRQLRDASLILIPTAKSLDILPPDPAIRQKVRPLNYGVDTDLFQPELNLPSQPASILFLANLVRRKGVLQVIQAFEQIHAQHPGCRLIIAGSGPDEALVRERVQQSPAAASIVLRGHVARNDVPGTLNRSTLYCLPSFAEPFGMTALEAMACGKPVVGASTGGLGLLLDQEGARTVAPGDVQNLAAALHEILVFPELQRTMGAHNRTRAVREFSWNVVIERLESLYRDLLAPAPAPEVI